MVTPAAKREAVRFLVNAAGLSERRVCALVGLPRATCRYQPKPKDDVPLRERLKRLASERPRFGYYRLYVLLRREGVVVNHKRVYRLYREQGLQVRRRKRKRIGPARRVPLTLPTQPNTRWSMDFVHDGLANGRRIRVLTMVDDCTRECLALEVDTALSGLRVTQVLQRLQETRGLPEAIVVDNGPEFAGRVLDAWAYRHGLRLQFIQPGKPTQNAYVESFNGKFRDECLSLHWFTSITDAKEKIEAWRMDYNTCRPHSSLNHQTPEEFVQCLKHVADCDTMKNLSSRLD